LDDEEAKRSGQNAPNNESGEMAEAKREAGSLVMYGTPTSLEIAKDGRDLRELGDMLEDSIRSSG